ncbi:MAG TPA: DEAD/DEAH box helicase, partial [Thermoanaerobaculia bacterium]
FSFSKDSPWQKEFEDAFEYVETPDQAQAIADVKRDMQSSKPMDRLLCGDVGYGKTEVAMRAAFKAVLDGKQVAVLAPTTILADQHFRTFQRRFAAFPVTIDLLSRFRTTKEQKEILRKTADGNVDILIATHRMLAKDLAFRDLGLLIVDEEQRFGVAQKERLKEWKTSIDVLSMSATPIPRSLHLSLSGLRDLSIIETPPRDRLAIETQVVPRKPEVIREAIEAELERGGQVFFVHNRVESIGGVKQELERLLPELKIAVAHGAMRENELEKAMLRFTSREADLLLATTIIENGLDIPSANTILIDRAEAYGLAQLYQLRGRVGRSDKPASAFLLVHETAALSDTARRRLASIQEFCDLGAGFRIAAKDLEIRGSGNILGGEQSGQIASVGFETYLSLLEEMIREIKGEEPIPERTVTLSLGLDLTIPHSYVPDENWRMMIYKKIARAKDDSELAETEREIADRFGEPPLAVRRLVAYSRLRARAEQLGVTSLTRQAGQVHLRFAEDARLDGGRLLEFVRRTRGARLSPARVLSVPSPAGDALLPEITVWLKEFAV